MATPLTTKLVRRRFPEGSREAAPEIDLEQLREHPQLPGSKFNFGEFCELFGSIEEAEKIWRVAKIVPEDDDASLGENQFSAGPTDQREEIM